jgi:hypothetical protein
MAAIRGAVDHACQDAGISAGHLLNEPPTGIIAPMITRRDSLLGAVAFLCDLAAQRPKARRQLNSEGIRLVFRHDLPNITMDDWEVTVSYLDYAPGRVGKVHHHAGLAWPMFWKATSSQKFRGRKSALTNRAKCSLSRPEAHTKYRVTPAILFATAWGQESFQLGC